MKHELAIVAAGSLLEFVLEDHDFSMPVGRVSFMQMEPMSFVEFLWAMGEEKLAVGGGSKRQVFQDICVGYRTVNDYTRTTTDK